MQNHVTPDRLNVPRYRHERLEPEPLCATALAPQYIQAVAVSSRKVAFF
jgi:hypothetical protein